PHRYQWRSHLSADAATNVSRLTRQEAFRQVVSTQSSISSQDNEDPPSLNEEIRVVRLGPSESSIPNVDDLRVSDIIISHRKKESTDSTKTLIGRTDSNGYSSSSKASSDYSGKFSNVSSLEGRISLSSIGGSPYVSSLSSSSSSGGSSYNYPSRNPPPHPLPTSTSSVTKTIPVILQSPKSSNIK
uniref:Uncharacterized protein n=1 Tax=Panagrolaimus sp. ES5 TaxID=591445 RepID=A0AC34GM19_9BILA